MILPQNILIATELFLRWLYRLSPVQPGLGTWERFSGRVYQESFIHSFPIFCVKPSGHGCTIILYPSPWYLSALFMSLFIFIIHKPLLQTGFCSCEGLEKDGSSYKWPHSYANVGVCAQQNVHYKAHLLQIINSSASNISCTQPRDFSDCLLAQHQ